MEERKRRSSMDSTKDPDRGSALRRVRGVIDRLVREGTAVARSDGSLHSLFPVAVYATEGEALRDWVLREGARRSIEIGLGYGISALYICEGLLGNADPTMHHVAIDPFQAPRFSDCGLQFLAEAGVADLAAAIPRRSPKLRLRIRRRQPSLREVLRGPILPQSSRPTGRYRRPR